MRFAPLGDAAIAVELGEAVDEVVCEQVSALVQVLEAERPAWVEDIVPANTTVAVFYAGDNPGYEVMCGEIRRRTEQLGAVRPRPIREMGIPVCYDREFAPDLAEVARRAGLSEEAVVALHCGADYRVLAVGFAPGFPYLGGLPGVLHTPRLATPRRRVPAGSVGIGGAQTGIYPFASPGGWNLIGCTPMTLFDPGLTPPVRLQVGDRVSFQAITREEFESWR